MDFFTSATSLFFQVFDILQLNKKEQHSLSSEIIHLSLAETTKELIKNTPSQSALIFEQLLGDKIASAELYTALVQHFGAPMVKKLFAHILHENLALYLQRITINQSQKDAVEQLIDESSIFESIELGKLFLDFLEE